MMTWVPVSELGFEQHRVHVRVVGDPTGDCLHRLGAANLATVNRRRRIQSHVLRLERGHGPTPAR